MLCNPNPVLSRDNCRFAPNTDQADGNGDEIGDACQDSDGDGRNEASDNCPTMVTSVVTDLYSDGIGDACDLDRDGDYICDQGGPISGTSGVPSFCPASDFGADNCPSRYNRNQRDTDGDSLECADGLAPLHPNHGCGDECDNCAGCSNPDQRDLDRDGRGDACDDDRDGDSVPDGKDNCPDVRNRDQARPRRLDKEHRWYRPPRGCRGRQRALAGGGTSQAQRHPQVGGGRRQARDHPRDVRRRDR